MKLGSSGQHRAARGVRRSRPATQVAAFGVAALATHTVVSLFRVNRKRATAPIPVETSEQVTIVQPIISGDPALADTLRECLAATADYDHIWLVDDDDPVGIDVVNGLANSASRVRVIVCPACPPGTNPKVFKLQIAWSQLNGIMIVCDDDTMAAPTTIRALLSGLKTADLVCGLPFYEFGNTGWEHLLSSWVNSNSPFTYLSGSEPISINGMFYAFHVDALTPVNGFSSISNLMCDDLELARLFWARGLKVAQTVAPVRLRTSISSGSQYFQLMQRWMVFAIRLLETKPKLTTVLSTALATFLPTVSVSSALLARSPLVLARTLASLWATNRVRAQLARDLSADAALRLSPSWMIVTDLLQPVHLAHAWLSRGNIKWRNRDFVAKDGKLSNGS